MPIFTGAEIIKYLEGYKSILIVGPPFTGKTRSLWTLIAYLKKHNLGPLHVVDLDQKIEALVAALQDEMEARRDHLLDYLVVHRIQVKPKLTSAATKVTASRDMFEAMKATINEFENKIDINTGKWKQGFECGAVIIDSLSKFNEITRNWVAESLGHDFGAEKTDARNDYTIVMNKVKQTIDGLKMLPCITGWIAHIQLVQSGAEGKLMQLPSVDGKNTLAPALAKEFNCVLYSTGRKKKEHEKSDYVWQVQPGGQIPSAGTTARSDLPMYVEQDFRKVFRD